VLEQASSPPTIARPSRRWPPLVVLIPSVVVATAVVLPLIYLVIRAFEAGPGVWGFIARPRTLQVVWTSVWLAFAVTTATLLISLPIAWLTTRTDLRFRRFWFVLAVLPLVIPSYVGAYAFVSAFAPGGLISGALGFRINVYGFWGAFTVLTLFNYPFMLLALRAGLRGLDPSLEEASRSLGRTAWQTFLTVTLPHLRPAIAAGALLVSLYVLSDFGAVSMLRTDTFTRAIYVQYQNSFNRANAAVLGLMLVALIGVVFVVDAFVRGRARLDRVGSGAPRRAKRSRVGRWAPLAHLYLGTVVCFALLAPLSVIVAWFVRGVATQQLFELQLAPVWNTVGVSLAAAALATLAAVPVAVLAVRHKSKASALLERLTYTGYALPGIVVALALVFFGVRLAPSLYQTTAMLIFAYLVLFIPQALGNIRAALLQLNPHLEEAARSLGRSPARTLIEVTLPQVKSGLLTGAALVFLTTMKELPATLLLAPIGFHTLATRIWSWSVEAFFAQAAPYALILVLVSSLSVAILLAQEERAHR
jgi:iron(III) transport system permease protein